MTHPRNRSTSRGPALLRGLCRALGMFCLALGVIGCVLPILPGLPFMIVGARLLDPRDPLLRLLLMVCRRTLRRLRSAERPLLRRIGLRLTSHWNDLARLLTG